MESPAPFDLHGPAQPAFPVVISVPHAGRDYPAEMASLCRLPLRNLQVLEDRLADRLVEMAVEAGFQCIVAHTPRAWIDLNRSPQEFDPDLIKVETGLRPTVSHRVRGGLGIIPRRIGNGGDIWREKIGIEEFRSRLETIHTPYHEAISTLLEKAVEAFGQAILIDLHSMPPIRTLPPAKRPGMVIGDQYGRCAENWISALTMTMAESAGIIPALNAPYAGGYSVERHGQPRKGMSAIQLEVDRELYLDAAREQVGPGLPAMQAFIRKLARALADEAMSLPLAAE